MRVRDIRPRRPEQNGKVERSHRIDEEEFWRRYVGQDFDLASSREAAGFTRAAQDPAHASHDE